MSDSPDREPPEYHCPRCGLRLPEKDSSCPSCEDTVADSSFSRPGFTGPKQVAHYRIIREIGHGGMGTVFEAHDEKMNRRVALKVLSRHHAPSERVTQRFEREAWIAGKLDHPNLVKVYERGVWEELSYYSMEMLDGGSIHDVIQNMKRWGRDDRLGLEFGSREYIHWALTQVIAVARGLAYAHRHGVVHRDVKPMNLVLSHEEDCVKITDFGLAIDDDVSRMTTEGKLLGTVAYMTPEQILGRTREIDQRTDVYALGVTLFEMLTLELPYSAETQQLFLNAVLTTEARRPSRLNERVGHDLEVVIGKALEKAPRDRYASVDALADDLENVLNLRPIQAQPPGTAGRLWSWIRRRPLHAALVLLLAIGLPAVGLLGWRSVEHSRLQQQMRIEALWDEARMLVSPRSGPERKQLAQQILELDPEHENALRALAVIDYREALATVDSREREAAAERALRTVDRLVHLSPAKSWPRALKAVMLERLGRAPEARAERETLERLRSDQPDADDLNFDGLLARENGDHQEAVRIFSELIRLTPTAVLPTIYRGEALEALGQLDRAAEDYRLAARLAPEWPLPSLYLAGVLAKRGMIDDAEAHVTRAQELEPDSANVREELAELLIRWGQSAYNRGELDQGRRYLERAEQQARRAVELDPGRPWAHIKLGFSLVERNRRAGASNPALIDEAVGHYEQALLLAGDAVRSDRVRAAALHNLCDATLELADHGHALRRCGEALELEPDDPVNHYNMAGLYALTGRTDEALEALARNVELGDDDWRYLSRDEWFETIRDDPRFVDLVERMKAGSDDR